MGKVLPDAARRGLSPGPPLGGWRCSWAAGSRLSLSSLPRPPLGPESPCPQAPEPATLAPGGRGGCSPWGPSRRLQASSAAGSHGRELASGQLILDRDPLVGEGWEL